MAQKTVLLNGVRVPLNSIKINHEDELKKVQELILHHEGELKKLKIEEKKLSDSLTEKPKSQPKSKPQTK